MPTSTQLRPSPPPSDHDRRVIDEHVHLWEEASILSHDQAEAIFAYERASLAEAPGRRIPLVAELIGYVGVALVMAAAIVILGEYFGDLSRAAQLTALGAATLVFLVAGWPLHRRAEPALQRLAAVLWAVSTGAFAGFLGVSFYGGSDAPESVARGIGLSALVAAYAGVLLWLRTSWLLQLALFVGVGATIVTAGIWGLDDSGWRWFENNGLYVMFAVALVVATAWIFLGRAGVLLPQPTAYAFGAIGAGLAPMYVIDESIGFALLAGVAIAAAVLAASVWLRSVPSLVLGAIALFGYVTGCAVHFLQDSAGLPVALLLSGLLLVGIALLTVRLGRITKSAA